MDLLSRYSSESENDDGEDNAHTKMRESSSSQLSSSEPHQEVEPSRERNVVCSSDPRDKKRSRDEDYGGGGEEEDKSSNKKSSSTSPGVVKIICASEASPDLFTRSIPHRPGHWSGHIYVPICWSSETSSDVRKSIRKFQKILQHKHYSGTIVRHDKLHLSLSKPFSLQISQIDSFVDQLAKKMRYVNSTTLYVDNSTSNILVNDEKTRSFWGWKVQSNSTLKHILENIDSLLKSYNQPTYYSPPIFHISLASIAANFTVSYLNDENSDFSSSSSDEASSDDDEGTSSIPVNQIDCTFGTTKSYVIRLKSG